MKGPCGVDLQNPVASVQAGVGLLQSQNALVISAMARSTSPCFARISPRHKKPAQEFGIELEDSIRIGGRPWEILHLQPYLGTREVDFRKLRLAQAGAFEVGEAGGPVIRIEMEQR